MCGIILLMRKDGRPAIKQLLKTFEKQRGRGTLGFGYVAFDEGVVTKIDRSTGEGDIKHSLREIDAKAVLFHHRYPTSTPNFREATHPIYVSNVRLNFDYYVVHNGVISNDHRLKPDHEKLGYRYTTQMVKQEVWTTNGDAYNEGTPIVKWNDSEALAIEVAEGIENNKHSIEATGSIAFIALQVDKNTQEVKSIYYGRNTSPLELEDNGSYFKLSSDGGGKSIDAQKLFKLDLATGVSTERAFALGSAYTYTPTKTTDPARQGRWFDKDDDKVINLPAPKKDDKDNKDENTEDKKKNRLSPYLAVLTMDFDYAYTAKEIETLVHDFDVWSGGFGLSRDMTENEYELEIIRDVCEIKAEKLIDKQPKTADLWLKQADACTARIDLIQEYGGGETGTKNNDDTPEVEFPPNYDITERYYD